MPTYAHKCSDESCNHEWEDTYSIKADPPKVCPKCNNETAQRLIYGKTLGKMDITIDELKASLPEWQRKTMNDINKSEKALANFVGEDKYHKNESMRDRFKRGY